jgi:hypothetical protein
MMRAELTIPHDGAGADLTAQLGPDLTALVAGLGVPVVEASPITGLAARTLSRATFRLTLADGRMLKGRRLDAAADADRIRTIVTSLARPEMPRIVACGGTALLEEWIAGVPLGRRVPDVAFLVRCGRILGAIHKTPVDASAERVSRYTAPAPLTGPERRPTAEAHHTRIDWAVGELLRDGLVRAAVAADLRAVARAHRPVEIATSFVHRDFCRENIVRTPGGHPSVVDSGSVGIDACDFDLARTWYRWPLPPDARLAIDAGYRECRPSDAYAAHFPFWAVAVLTDAALFRARAGTPGSRVPLRHLGRLLQDLRRGDARLR